MVHVAETGALNRDYRNLESVVNEFLYPTSYCTRVFWTVFHAPETSPRLRRVCQRSERVSN